VAMRPPLAVQITLALLQKTIENIYWKHELPMEVHPGGQVDISEKINMGMLNMNRLDFVKINSVNIYIIHDSSQFYDYLVQFLNVFQKDSIWLTKFSHV
jgi:hypothetical protein